MELVGCPPLLQHLASRGIALPQKGSIAGSQAIECMSASSSVTPGQKAPARTVKAQQEELLTEFKGTAAVLPAQSPQKWGTTPLPGGDASEGTPYRWCRGVLGNGRPYWWRPSCGGKQQPEVVFENPDAAVESEKAATPAQGDSASGGGAPSSSGGGGALWFTPWFSRSIPEVPAAATTSAAAAAAVTGEVAIAAPAAAEGDSAPAAEPEPEEVPGSTAAAAPPSTIQEEEEDSAAVPAPPSPRAWKTPAPAARRLNGKRRAGESEDHEAEVPPQPQLPPPPKRRASEGICKAATPMRVSGAGKKVPSPRSPTSVRQNVQEVVCVICCETSSASNAVLLGCRHGWYCSPCMTKYAEARLELGALQIPCPECQVPIPERSLRQLLPEELVERFLVRSLEQAVSGTADLRPCPTPDCPFRVALEDAGTAKLKCPMCKRTSCFRCGAQPYHNRVTCERYAERLQGKSSGTKATENTDTEGLRRWMCETGAKQCPTCQMVVTKQNLKNQSTQYSECHKMMCRNCNTRFCFKCLAILTGSYSCGCTRDEHGFIDPRTGKRMGHFRQGSRKEPKTGKVKGKS